MSHDGFWIWPCLSSSWSQVKVFCCYTRVNVLLSISILCWASFKALLSLWREFGGVLAILIYWNYVDSIKFKKKREFGCRVERFQRRSTTWEVADWLLYQVFQPVSRWFTAFLCWWPKCLWQNVLSTALERSSKYLFLYWDNTVIPTRDGGLGMRRLWHCWHMVLQICLWEWQDMEESCGSWVWRQLSHWEP